MSEDLQNFIEQTAAIASQQMPAPLWGLVSSYDPAAHTAKVILQPSQLLTSDLPIALMGGLRYAPVQGQMAFLVPESHENDALVISGFAFNDKSPPPQTQTNIDGGTSYLQPGEWEAIGPNGASIRLNKDGTIFLLSSQGFNIQSNLTIKGDISVTGQITATKNIQSQEDVLDHVGKLDTLRSDYNEHEHPTGGIGAAETGPTNTPCND